MGERHCQPTGLTYLPLTDYSIKLRMRHVWEWGLVIAITMYIMYQVHLLMNTSKFIVSLPSPWVLYKYIGLEVYFLCIKENQVDERNLLYFILIIFLLRTYLFCTNSCAFFTFRFLLLQITSCTYTYY